MEAEILVPEAQAVGATRRMVYQSIKIVIKSRPPGPTPRQIGPPAHGRARKLPMAFIGCIYVRHTSHQLGRSGPPCRTVTLASETDGLILPTRSSSLFTLC